MDKGTLIKRQLDKSGERIYLKDGDWCSMPFRACINHLWRKKSSDFEPHYTELGTTSSSSYYLYTGPFNHDITSLGDNAVVVCGDACYEFKCREAVCFDDKIIYYTGILRRLEGESNEA